MQYNRLALGLANAYEKTAASDTSCIFIISFSIYMRQAFLSRFTFSHSRLALIQAAKLKMSIQHTSSMHACMWPTYSTANIRSAQHAVFSLLFWKMYNSNRTSTQKVNKEAEINVNIVIIITDCRSRRRLRLRQRHMTRNKWKYCKLSEREQEQ